MALQQQYDSEDGIPQELRAFYTERDGRFVLEVDPPIEDVSGLKNALNQERTLRREGERSLMDLRTRFEGIDPDEFHKLRERVKGLDDADIYDKQGIEALVLRRTESMKSEHERQMRQRENEINSLKETVSAVDRRWRQDRIKTALLDAAARAGVSKQAMPDAVQRGLAVFGDLDDQGTVIARDGDDIRYGKDGISPLTPDEWMQSLKQDAPHLWPPSSGGGAPVYHSGTGPQIDWQSLPPTERLTKFRELQRAGRT